MNSISSLISILSETDKRNYLHSLSFKNKRSDVKNIQLFKILDRDKNATNIDVIIYGKPSKGAYHALCKRLHDSLIDFIASRSFENESSIEMNSLKLVLASRILCKHQQYKAAYKTLNKAEIISKKHSLFNILNEVYQTKIMHSHNLEQVDLVQVIDNFKSNKQYLYEEENLNLFYASLLKELQEDKVIFNDILDKNLTKFNISITSNLSYQSLFKIIEISNKVANLTRDYHTILEFVEEACLKIETSERIVDKYLNEHIQILYYLGNTYFRIKNFKKSKEYFHQMHRFMLLNNSKHFDAFYPQYYLVVNLIQLFEGDVSKVSDALSKFDYHKYKKNDEYCHDLKLTWATSLFLEDKFKESLSIYRNFYRNDKWYAEQFGNIWVIKKNVLELLLLVELNHLDLFESRFTSFRKKHTKHLINRNEKRVLDFIKFISDYYYKTKNHKSEEYISKVQESLQVKDESEDIFILCFYAWLMSKINNTSTYQTCLNYIHSN
ncbi:hypothetical protein [Urechidicola vernalis]|uniref:Tetratricopeptide repeat protein n=1 Tax=Urechidicola vernalis TaxID=3075600 RepID=A0ABU2Y113_9FLAO|nr:hypothetical protein [Urechidicola sp. P050]MDT0551869.1 hypothetical protein [Urechidicola sp. P050]